MDAARFIYSQSKLLIHKDPLFNDIYNHNLNIHVVIERMAHAMGRCDFINQIVAKGNLCHIVKSSIKNNNAVLCDSTMTKASIIKTPLSNLSYPKCYIEKIDKANTLTRAAQAVLLWKQEVKNSIVVIGQNPSALRILIKCLKNGWDMPLAIIAFPVGYYDAEQSKQELIDFEPDCSWITLKGRIGGSALAGAAFNACFKELV